MKQVLRTCPQTSVAQMTASSSKQAVIWLLSSHHNHLNGPAHHFFSTYSCVTLSIQTYLSFVSVVSGTSVAQQKGKLTKAGCDLIRATMSQPLWRACSLCKTVATTHLLHSTKDAEMNLGRNLPALCPRLYWVCPP